MIETSIVWYESCGLTDVRRMDGSASQITREQKTLLNFDEVVALWYFVLTLWYGWFKHRNSRSAIERRATRDSANSVAQFEFAPIHWLILAVSIMGLANFLFSFSLLEVMNHKSSIGSSVLKLSYINMIFACLLHPCTLSLGVLAPKVAFGYDRFYYFPSESTARSESTKSTTICLAALVCAQLVLRLMENLMVLNCFNGRTVKLADFFEYLLDGVFLAQMAQSLYKIIFDMSRDSGVAFGFDRWQVWWKSRRLSFFLVLYTIFVAVSTVLVLIGISAFFGASVLGNEHSVYSNYKVHCMNDLLLLTGIAILLRPKPSGTAQRLEINHMGGEDDDPEIDYHLLRAGSNEEEIRAEDAENYEEVRELSYEMTAATMSSSDSHSIP
mmetsp:Transcript_21669/g.53765  ORF Transcript_21669/g.53765 Transcript_21669/m.53765 type:complete len:384 (+) Transcript_21669:238-1389(+)